MSTRNSLGKVSGPPQSGQSTGNRKWRWQQSLSWSSLLCAEDGWKRMNDRVQNLTFWFAETIPSLEEENADLQG